MKAVVESKNVPQNRSSTGKRGIISLSINVYGPIENADRVGDVLSRASAFLQHPFSLEGGYEYFNPQMFRSGTEMQNLTHLVGLTESDIKAKIISDEVTQVFESLDNIQLHNEESQRSINLQLEAVTTQLKQYVKSLIISM